MSGYQIPDRARAELAAERRRAKAKTARDEKRKQALRAKVGGYTGFRCYSCGCEVDHDVKGDHAADCEHKIWHDKYAPKYD